MYGNEILRRGAMTVALLLTSAWTATACEDGSSGAAVGEACVTPGSIDECETDAVCDDDSKRGTICLARCDRDEDCAADEQCTGTSGSLKGCHAR